MQRGAAQRAAAGRVAQGGSITAVHLTEGAWQTVVFAVVGARVLFVALHARTFLADPWETFRIWHGGFAQVGGIMGAAVSVSVTCRRRGLSVAAFADGAAPGLVLGMAIGRIGCFLGGCCYGVPCSQPWGVRFQLHDQPGVLTPPSHPTQLYEAFAHLILLSILLWWGLRSRCPGDTALLTVSGYGLLRLAVEPFRTGDPSALVFAGFTGVQITLIGIVALSSAAFVRLHLRSRPLRIGAAGPILPSR